MDKNFNLLDLVQEIISFSPRQLENETKTAEFLKKILRENNVSFEIHAYTVDLPDVKKAELFADDQEIPVKPASFVSGKIENNDTMISNLLSSRICQDKANINFNPKSEDISQGNNYFAPSVAINKSDVQKVLDAEEVKGEVIVEKVSHTAENILVGSSDNPEKLVFAHYDSVNTGAIDNASGVAVMMKAILNKPETLKNTLYIFSANEEFSYDKPIYWGRGFRELETSRPDLFDNAKEIFPVDCVGNGDAHFSTDPELITLGFPIANIKKQQEKVFFLTADFNHLMTVYHSDSDDGRGMTEEWMEDAYQKLVKRLSR